MKETIGKWDFPEHKDMCCVTCWAICYPHTRICPECDKDEIKRMDKLLDDLTNKEKELRTDIDNAPIKIVVPIPFTLRECWLLLIIFAVTFWALVATVTLINIRHRSNPAWAELYNMAEREQIKADKKAAEQPNKEIRG